MSDLHRRSAERIRDLCGLNGGVYVKLGQHLSQLDFVLPSEFIEVLRCMLDQVGNCDSEWEVSYPSKSDVARSAPARHNAISTA